MSQRIPLADALATARENRFGRMLGRSADNRVEPECWPHIQPRFAFAKDQLFFAIGSCFAKNISKRLLLDGYRVHGGVVLEGNRRNRYTPAAIYQELAWAKRIFDRDDTPRDEDILPLLLELGPNRWTDIWSRPEKGTAPSLEEAIKTRRELYAYFRGAFVADVVIITLGLIESWWDDVSQSYVEFDTPWARRDDKHRFSFERLSFDRCKAYVEQALDLLAEGDRRVLLTTSPVVLARTFTADDIIVANTHSKSVLRAVAGEATAQREAVDYFPSYEIATITRQPEVWEDDLIHINPNFVARIMQHVTEAYVPGSVSDDLRAAMRFAQLVESRQLLAAQKVYDGLAVPLAPEAAPAFHIAAVRLANERQDRERAIAHALLVEADDPAMYVNHADWMFEISRTLRDSGTGKRRGREIGDRLWSECAARPDLFQAIFVMATRTGDSGALDELSVRIVDSGVTDAILTGKVCAHFQARGRIDEALRLVDRQLAATPDHPLILLRLIRLHLAKREQEKALQATRRLVEVDPENSWAKLTLARILLRLGRAEECLAVAERMIDAGAGNSALLTLRARALWKLNRTVEAREAAQSALVRPDFDDRCRAQLQPILRFA